MKILITAFGPFNNFISNPSQQVLESIRENWIEKPTFIMEWETLDVNFNKVDQFINHIEHHHDLILHLGVATGSEKMRLEINGINLKSGIDVEGHETESGPIDPYKKDYNSTFPIDILNDITSENSSIVEISYNAGEYLCNYIYFKSLDLFSNNSAILFIHIADFQNKTNAPGIKIQAEIIVEIIHRFLIFNNINLSN